jgi:hypothetical protein
MIVLGIRAQFSSCQKTDARFRTTSRKPRRDWIQRKNQIPALLEANEAEKS